MRKYIILNLLWLLSLGIEKVEAENLSNEKNRSKDEKVVTEIYVTGALTPLGLDRLGKPVSIITHESLQERSEATVGEMLSSEPGVSGTYFGPGASRPVIRGQSKQRVRVLENGFENGDVSDVSDDHLVSVDPLSVQRIDILRGPSTLLYGSSAIGGVVNMIDESIAENPIGRSVTGEIDLRKGNSADNQSTGGLSLKGDVDSFNWYLSSFYRETDDIEIPGFAQSKRFREIEEHDAHEDEHDHEHEHEHDHDHEHEELDKGTLENSDTMSKGFKIGGSHVWDQGFFGVALKTFNSEYGILGGHHHHEDESLDDAAHSSEEEGSPRLDVSQVRLENRGEMRVNDDFFKAVRFGATYSNYNHKEREGREVATNFDKDSFEGRVELTHSHEDGFQGGFGTQLRYDDFKAQGSEAFIPPNKTFAPAIFAVEDYKIRENLVWQLGGRYEYANVDLDDGSSQDFNMISASTGPVINIDSEGIYTTGLTFSYSERAPTATELFSDGAHLATSSFEIGNQNLNKEKSVGTEIILRKNSGRLTGGTSLFLQQYFDYINLIPSGDEKEGLPVYLYEMNKARFWGFEVDTDYQLLPYNPHGLNLYGQIDYVRGENLSDNDPLPRITPLRGKIGLKYKYETASTYIEGVFVDEQDRTADFELPTDSYSLLNAGVSYQLPLDSKNVYEIYGRANNLTDEEARAHTSFLKDVAPFMGRSFFAGMRFSF